MKPSQQFRYSKKEQRYSLLFGILWLVIFVFYKFFRPDSYFGYGYLAIGIVFIGTFIYKKTSPYASIKNGVLSKNMIFSKRIKLDDITDIQYFSGKYKLTTTTSEMTINTMAMDKRAVEDLKNTIKHINFSKS